MKKLYKSNNKIISGVAAGIAEYLGIDPTVIRILWVLFLLFAGSGLILYLICVVLMPNREY